MDMCGILGVRRSWVPDRSMAQRALDTMRWRGPDGVRLIQAGDWWLGVARLAITDARAAQPLTCAETGRVALFNGAVTSAGSDWARFEDQALTRNDGELALLRMRDRGPQALGDACGPYALAVLDPINDDLWVARDPEGEKPLYLIGDGQRTVAFASTVSALRALALDVHLDADERSRFLRYGFSLGPDLNNPGLTFTECPSGVHRAGARPTALPDSSLPVSTNGISFRDRVLAAVRRCATAEVPVGFCLSGGIDSSCIAASLQELGLDRVAYQFRAEGTPDEERGWAYEIAKATETELKTVEAGVEILDDLSDLTRMTGLPQGDPSVFAALALARRARADGIKVLLSGEGADDLWLGYDRHRAAVRLPGRGWRRLPGPRLAMGRMARLIRALAANRPYDSLLEVVPPGFLEEVLVPGIPETAELPDGGGPTALERARWVDRHIYLRRDLLPKLDTALMAAGVEGRCPFLDPGLLSSAPTQASDPRTIIGKRHLRDAFRDQLPPGSLDRKKIGFGLPLDRWLRGDCSLTDLLRDRRTLEREHIDATGLTRMLDRHRSGALRVGHGLYLLAAYEVYLRYLEESAA